LDRIFFFDKPAPAIAITMDDSYRSWYDLGKPVMDELGIRTTINAIRVYSDPTAEGYSAPSNRLTEDMIKRFVDGGHELAFHMTGNSAPEDFTPDAVHAEIVAFKKWARNKFGQDVTTGAYPGGEQGYFQGPNYPVGHALVGQPKPGWKTGDDLITSREVFAEHFPLARSIARVSPESDPPADNTLLKCFMYQYGTGVSYTTPAINQGYIDTVVQHGGVAVASYHELVSGTPTIGVTTQYSIADFTANMQYIASQPITPLTCREAFTRSVT
jgi:peptidoglycan/xylan/chitin deacetylase (PgdA/CDA1 family)